MTQQLITICHAAGQEGTDQYITLHLPPAAVATHLDPETGTPQAGHENDYLGPCEEEVTTTTTTTTTTVPQTTTTTVPETTTTTVLGTTTTTDPGTTTSVPVDGSTTTTTEAIVTTSSLPHTGAGLGVAPYAGIAIIIGSILAAVGKHRRQSV